MDSLLQALTDYVEAYIATVKKNPEYQCQLHLPEINQVPMEDPPSPRDVLDLMTLSERMGELNPEVDALPSGEKWSRDMTLWGKFECMFGDAQERLPGPPPKLD